MTNDAEIPTHALVEAIEVALDFDHNAHCATSHLAERPDSFDDMIDALSSRIQSAAISGRQNQVDDLTSLMVTLATEVGTLIGFATGRLLESYDFETASLAARTAVEAIGDEHPLRASIAGAVESIIGEAVAA